MAYHKCPECGREQEFKPGLATYTCTVPVCVTPVGFCSPNCMQRHLYRHIEQRDNKLAEAKELLQDMAGAYHEVAENHPPENFRGCTHPDCKKHRRLIKNLDLTAFLSVVLTSK